MANASNAVIYIEQGQSMVDFALMNDSGDHRTFKNSDDVWSGRSGFEPVVRPNGIVSGRGLVIPAVSGTASLIDVLGFTAYSIGILRSPAADQDLVITRPGTDISRISSIQMTSAGNISIVPGIDGADALFVETRGVAGGPPFVLADSVELGQVRINTSAPTPITSSQIFQIVGQHSERWDFPVWGVNTIGLGSSSDSAPEMTAFIKFASPLPLSHTGDVAKRVYTRYNTPTFGELARTLDFAPAETTHSLSSTQFYNGAIGSRSSALGQGKFTALLDDGIVDSLVKDKDQNLTVKFFPDRNKTPYILTQGVLGLTRSFPVSDQVSASVTISSEFSSAEFTG